MQKIDSELDYGAINALARRATNLETFSEIIAWDEEAKAVIDKIDSILEKIPAETETLKTDLKTSQEAHKKLPFLKKLFSGDQNSNKLKKEISILDELSTKLLANKENLENLIDATPDNSDEANLMIKELKLLKKDLTFQKTVIRGQVRDINQNARAQNSAISNQIFFTNAKVRRIQKMGVREQKENSLQPREQQIRALDYQIIDLDKKIHNIERIKLASAKEEEI